MSYLEENEWMLLNETAYNVSFIYSFDQMRIDFLKWIRMLIRYDAATFSFVKDGELCDTIAAELSPAEVKVFEKAYEEDNPLRWILLSGRNYAYCQSDVLSLEKMEESKLYREFYKPKGLVWSMGTNIVFREDVVGLIMFFRTKGRGDFEKRDLFVMDQLQKHLAYRLYYEAKKSDSRFFWAKGYQEKISRENNLTSRESELMEYALQGLANEAIAEQMKISVNTVKKHFHNLYEKMHVKNRVQLLQCMPRSSEKIDFDEL